MALKRTAYLDGSELFIALSIEVRAGAKSIADIGFNLDGSIESTVVNLIENCYSIGRKMFNMDSELRIGTWRKLTLGI